MALLPAIDNFRRRKRYKLRRECDPEEFQTVYQFNSENVDWLAEPFIGDVNETRGGALSGSQQIMIFLRYIADPGFQSGVAEDVGVDQITVSKVIHKVGYHKCFGYDHSYPYHN